jgi:serine/threonine protein kinase/Tfp pilus assembly protein PilF
MSVTSDERNPIEVLAEEFLERRRRGERPALSEYMAQHPELAEEIQELFPVLLDVEDARLEAAEATGPPAGPAAPCPERLGDYRLVREIGRGGMAIVYEAEQESLGRRVALKVLARAALAPQQVRRFEREARSAARLHHTNIVPVFGVGREGSTHYYVMQYIPGQPFDEVFKALRRLRDLQHTGLVATASSDRCGGQPSAADVAVSLWSGRFAPAPAEALGPADYSPSATILADPAIPAGFIAPGWPREEGGPSLLASSSLDVLSSSAELTSSGRRYARAIAGIGVQVAEALEYAAEQGIIHRDVKPSNILLDLAGTAWVTDFGLAKVAGQEDLSHSGDVVGTLRYMAPERFHGQADRRSDVYALGLTLYELLALRPAFDESDRGRLIRQVTEEAPPRLTTLVPTISRDLATIVHKAMAREPDQRYATAGALASDLKRFLEDRPIVARRPSLLDRAAKWRRRHRAAVYAGAAGLAVALAILVGSLGWIVRDRAARSELTEREVNRALVEVAANQGRAKWPEALEAVKRAEGFLAVGGSDLLLRRVRELRKDLEMVMRLEETRLTSPRNRAEADHDVNLAADAAYAEAYREYGIDVEALPTAEASERIRARMIRRELTVALDHWAKVRRDTRPSGRLAWQRLVAVARAADPDEWRNRVRDALESEDHQALNKLAAAVRISDLPVQTASLLGGVLDSEHAQSLLRRVQREHRDDFWINFQLAWTLDHATPPHLDFAEAIRFYTAALAVRPRNAPTHYFLAEVLCHHGRRDEAIAAYQKAIELNPDYVLAHAALGKALSEEGRFDEAIRHYEKVVALRPDNAEARNNLAWFLATGPDPSRRDPRRAVELGKRAVEVAPKNGACWNTLGVALYRADNWDGAIAALEKSMAMQGDNSFDWFFLAMAHWQRGQRDEARRHYDRAVRWMKTGNPNDTELRRFRAEAAALLQVEEQAPSEP